MLTNQKNIDNLKNKKFDKNVYKRKIFLEEEKK